MLQEEENIVAMTGDGVNDAPEYGRSIYDNFSHYVRFQMTAPVGFIATFLVAAFTLYVEASL